MGKKLQKGINDFETWCHIHNREDLLKEWDYAQNAPPSNYCYGSHASVKWICSVCGNKYSKEIHDRCNGTGCSVCSGAGEFKHRDPLFIEHPEFINELDIDKNSYKEVKNISAASTRIIYWKCKKGHFYKKRACQKKHIDDCPYCSNDMVLLGYNDLETWCKQNNRQIVINDWDYDTNKIDPKSVLYSSCRVVNFKCHICGYTWSTRINARTLQGTDCKKCNRRMSSSFPEQSVFWYVSYYFSDAKNGDRSELDGYELDIFVPSISLAIEYDSSTWHKKTEKDQKKDELCKEKNIVLIHIRETGCPELSISRSQQYIYKYGDWNALNAIIKDILERFQIKNPNVDVLRDEYKIKEAYYRYSLEQSLLKEYPEIAKEWHPTQNGHISAAMVSAQTHDDYYWLCSVCGYSYKASPHNRINAGSGCPICGRKKASKSQMFSVRNVDTGEIFDSVATAANKYGITKEAIGACCRGRTRTSGGYYWKYNDSLLNEKHKTASVNRSRANEVKQHKIRNIDTGEVFNSLKEAEEKTHIHNISAVCRGIRSVAGGYHWEYIKKDN